MTRKAELEKQIDELKTEIDAKAELLYQLIAEMQTILDAELAEIDQRLAKLRPTTKL